eukprot:2208288-Rhodomonas_salina.2
MLRVATGSMRHRALQPLFLRRLVRSDGGKTSERRAEVRCAERLGSKLVGCSEHQAPTQNFLARTNHSPGQMTV